MLKYRFIELGAIRISLSLGSKPVYEPSYERYIEGA